ncbi:MAG: hypothetical protein GY832_41955 [Chloroflexi bacterium]|nr:hypothetical protein [Chloroflexota bacterium]
MPLLKDLPHLPRPLTLADKEAVKHLAELVGQSVLEDTAPIQMVGSGANLNEATDNGMARLAELVDMGAEQVLNQVTLTGAVEIGRLPGVFTVTMLGWRNWAWQTWSESNTIYRRADRSPLTLTGSVQAITTETPLSSDDGLPRGFAKRISLSTVALWQFA